MAEHDLLAITQRYLAAIEAGMAGDDLAAFFTPDVVQEELPNRLVQQGAKRDLAAVLEGARRGQQVLRSQRFDLLNSMVSGDTVAIEVLWTGVLAVHFGTIPAGGEMRARSAMFIEFRDGKIATQRNYDCFEPF